MQEAGRLLVDLQFEGALEFFEENSNQEVDSTVQTDATTLKEEKGDVTDGLVVPQALLDEIIEESQVQFRIMQEEHESNLLALQQQHTQALERAELDLKLLSDQTDAKLADYQNRISELEDRLNVASATITRFESEVNYEKVRQKVCGTISKRIPGRSRVSVVSKGDDELLKLNGHIATHFPQTETGEYAGFYPADTTEVIERIGEVIAKGGEYLVFPEASFWWMDYYADLQTYLDSTHERIWQDEACIIYGL